MYKILAFFILIEFKYLHAEISAYILHNISPNIKDLVQIQNRL